MSVYTTSVKNNVIQQSHGQESLFMLLSCILMCFGNWCGLARFVPLYFNFIYTCIFLMCTVLHHNIWGFLNKPDLYSVFYWEFVFCFMSHTHTHTHTHTHAHAHSHTHTHTRTHALTHARTHSRTHARTHTHAHTNAHTHARTHAHTHTHTCTHARMLAFTSSKGI